MTRRRLAAALAAVIALGAGAWAVTQREAIMLDRVAARVPDAPLAERRALIEPAMTFHPPTDRASPYPVVVQFHGCAGMRADFMAQWAKVANEAGWMAVVVDSNGPRGIPRDRALETVCKGTELIGQERAGDVLAALDVVTARSDVDPDHVVLAGWSHGAWSIMDLISMDLARRAPAGLAHDGLAAPRLAGVILFYPYCGPGAWTRAGKWSLEASTLAFVAGADTVVDGPQCKRLFERLEARGAAVDLVYYPQADHVFDDAGLAPEHRHFHNPDAAADAALRYRAFLDATAVR